MDKIEIRRWDNQKVILCGEYKSCKFCGGTGFIFNQAKSTNDICQCRRISA